MDEDEHRSRSGGHQPEQKSQPITINPSAPACETSSPCNGSVSSQSRIREARDGLSLFSPKPGISANPDRARSRKEASARRVIARIVEVRRDLFGDEGIPAIADALHLPHRTWMNYEKGVVMPAAVLLCFLDLTSVDPHWLLTGSGPKYQGPVE